MTDTPETDAAAVFPSCNDSSDTPHPQGTHVATDFARRLERERDEWKDKCDKLAEALIELRDAEWLTLPGRANDIVESALSTLNQR